jgi:hypothetical protein
MANDVVIPPAPFTFDKVALQKKLDAVKENLQKYSGKPGYNPYFYNATKVSPLAVRFEAGEETKTLSDAILALDENHKPEAPGNTAKENREHGCIEPQSAGKSHAMGQYIQRGQV